MVLGNMSILIESKGSTLLCQALFEYVNGVITHYIDNWRPRVNEECADT